MSVKKNFLFISRLRLRNSSSNVPLGVPRCEGRQTYECPADPRYKANLSPVIFIKS